MSTYSVPVTLYLLFHLLPISYDVDITCFTGEKSEIHKNLVTCPSYKFKQCSERFLTQT